MDDISEELKAFLDYAAGRESEDSFVQRFMLIEKLIDNNRYDEIPKIKKDKLYRMKLYQEYNIIR